MKVCFKRILTVALVLAVLLLTGCSTPEIATAQQMVDSVAKVSTLLHEEKIQEAFQASSVSLQYTMQYDGFEFAWKNARRYSGDFVEEKGVLLTRWDSEERFVVDYGWDYTNIGVVTRFILNQYGEMISMTAYNYDFRDDTALPEGVTEREISFQTEEGLTIHGVITYPAGDGNVAGILLIPGSGAQNMDCPYGKVKIMRDLAYGLAEQGIASLRINKRTYETTEIINLTYSFDIEYMQDYTQAYDLLAEDERIDKVFVLGHSQGSLIAPRIDALKDSAGLVIMAGTNRDLWELHYDQNMQYLNINPDMDSLNAIAKEKAKAQKLKNQSALEAQQTSIFGYCGYYYWEASENKADLSLVNKPVLIMRGLDDFQTYDADWKSLKDGYANAILTQKEYDGLGHLFTPAQGLQSTEEYFTDDHVDETVIQDIAQFIAGSK